MAVTRGLSVCIPGGSADPALKASSCAVKPGLGQSLLAISTRMPECPHLRPGRTFADAKACISMIATRHHGLASCMIHRCSQLRIPQLGIVRAYVQAVMFRLQPACSQL